MVKKIGILFVMLFVIASCSKVPAGNVGVKVYLLGTSKGVDHEELGVGRYYIGMNEELYLFPTFQQNYVWTASVTEGSENDESISFQTKEGMKVSADVGISYHIDPTKVSALFEKFRKGTDEITDIYLRNYVRDSINKIAGNYEIESVYGAGKADLIEKVQADVSRQVSEFGIIVDKLYWIGDLRLPEAVTNALNAKVQATQKAQQRENEVAEARAEADKKIAEARGEAESLRLRNQSLSEKNIEWERLKVQRIYAEKWNGQLPTSMIPGSTVPFINIK